MDMNNPAKLKNLSEYKKWLANEHKIENLDEHANHYDSVAHKILRDFSDSNYWKNILKEFENINDKYLLKTGHHLFLPEITPKLTIKKFDDFLLKTFRKNVINNDNWPSECIDGWILPQNWFVRIKDIVRTDFVVKYLDGVEFLINEITSLSEAEGLQVDISLEAREEGYYAAHVDVKNEFEIPTLIHKTEKINTSIEIQITTQLQEVIKKLLHKHYRERRKKIKEPDIMWQWDYKSTKFSTNYLGHILHYIEGLIVDVREKQRGEKNDKRI